MNWLTTFMNSSIGKKFTMGVSGLLLCLFIAQHLVGNMMLFGGEALFNSYVETLSTFKLLVRIIEVIITLSLSPIKDEIDKLNTKIVFSTIIEINEESEEKKLLEEIILVRVPNEIYPEIRSLFISLFERSGFNKIKIEEKIDFNELYLKRTIQ